MDYEKLCCDQLGETSASIRERVQTAREIQNKLAHRYPILLVDRIVQIVEGKRIVGLKNFILLNNQHN